jgi:dTDP-4-dehydrorhamnose reductase
MLWITGAKGLLGSSLQKKCKAALQTGKEVDISEMGQVEAFLKSHPEITHIVNCAAYSQVDAAEKEREAAYRANALGPENLAIGAQKKGIKLIHISTDYVFPGTGNSPLKEEDPTAPCNYYGVSKLEGEQKALAHSALVIRTSGIFGSGGKNFVSKLFDLLQSQEEIRLTQDQWGRFTYAPDLAETILQMRDQKGLYQYANSGVASKYQFAVAMREEALRMGFPVMTESILATSNFISPCKRPLYSAFDTSKIERFVTIRPWQEALREFLCEKQPVSL